MKSETWPSKGPRHDKRKYLCLYIPTDLCMNGQVMPTQARADKIKGCEKWWQTWADWTRTTMKFISQRLQPLNPQRLTTLPWFTYHCVPGQMRGNANVGLYVSTLYTVRAYENAARGKQKEAAWARAHLKPTTQLRIQVWHPVDAVCMHVLSRDTEHIPPGAALIITLYPSLNFIRPALSPWIQTLRRSHNVRDHETRKEIKWKKWPQGCHHCYCHQQRSHWHWDHSVSVISVPLWWVDAQHNDIFNQY